ncbi:TPA: hypothetical protein DCE37_21805 [Candidatus Latescibacteria bacterium]|nr:hypothetical protein [Candidatus Latescibacterota bacterium]
MSESLQAVIFDMDGTITQPVIDWLELRDAIKAPPESSIMEHIRSLTGSEQQRATEILLETELRATEGVDLNEGFHELFAEVCSRGLRTAVVTNNHCAAMQNVLTQHSLRFDVALSRDDGELKPAPDLIKLALDQLDCPADQALGIGDSRLDVQACGAAGVRCLYLTHGQPKIDHEPAIVQLSEAVAYL